MKLIKQVTLYFFNVFTRATRVIDNCINKWYAQSKVSQNQQKGHSGAHTWPKKWSAARQTCRTGDDGLVYR